MMAEIAATEEAAKRGLELVVVVPAITVGPMLHQTLNYSSDHVARFLTGKKREYQNAVTAYIDVRDVARAHAIVYELHDARGGGGGHRYLCLSAVLHRAQFVQLLRDLFPHYPVTAKYQDEGDGKPMVKPYKFSNRMLKDLGMEFTPMRESLYDTVVMLQQKGHVTVPALPMPKRARL
jgi:cinnamoyl-CoA reductase